jgi:hypothetical protein
MTVAIKQRTHGLIEALPDDATRQVPLHALELRADADEALHIPVKYAEDLLV